MKRAREGAQSCEDFGERWNRVLAGCGLSAPAAACQIRVADG